MEIHGNYFFGLFLVLICTTCFYTSADDYFAPPSQSLSDLEDIEPSVIDEAYKKIEKEKVNASSDKLENSNLGSNNANLDFRLSFRSLYAATAKPYLLTSTLEEVAQEWFLKTFIGKESTLWRKNIQLAYDPYLQMGLKRLEWAYHAQAHPAEEKFLMYIPYQGISNQFLQLARAAVLAKSLNRTLIVPPMVPSEHQLDEHETKPIMEAFNTTPLLPWDSMYNVTDSWKNLSISPRFVPLTDGLLEYLLLPPRLKDVASEFGNKGNGMSTLLNNSSSLLAPYLASSTVNYRTSKLFQPEPKYYDPPFENTFMGRRSTLLFGYDGKIIRENGKFTQNKKSYFNARNYGTKMLIYTYGKWQSAESLGVSSQLFFGAFRLNPSFKSIPLSSDNLIKNRKGIKSKVPMRFSQVHAYFSTLSKERLLCISNLQHISMNGAENPFLHAVDYSDFLLKIGLEVNADAPVSNSSNASETPYQMMSPYIGMHWRAGDWQGACSVGEEKDKSRCYPSMSNIEEKVLKIRNYFSQTDILPYSEEINLTTHSDHGEEEIGSVNSENLDSATIMESKSYNSEDFSLSSSQRNIIQDSIPSSSIAIDLLNQIQSNEKDKSARPSDIPSLSPFHISSLYTLKEDINDQSTSNEVKPAYISSRNQADMQIRLATNEDNPGQLASFSSLGYKTFSKSGLDKLFVTLDRGIDDLLGHIFSYTSLSELYELQLDKTIQYPALQQHWRYLHTWISSMTYYQLEYPKNSDLFEKCYTLLKNSLFVEKDNIRLLRWKNILQNELNLPENALIEQQKYCEQWNDNRNSILSNGNNSNFKFGEYSQEHNSQPVKLKNSKSMPYDYSGEQPEPLAFSPFAVPAKALYSPTFRPVSNVVLDSVSGMPSKTDNSDRHVGKIAQSFCRLVNNPRLNPIILSLAPFMSPLVDTITLALSDGFLGNSYSTFSKAIHLRRRFMFKSIPKSKYAFYLSNFKSDDCLTSVASHQKMEEKKAATKKSYSLPISVYF